MIKVLSSPFREYLALHEHEIHTWLLSDGREKDPANHTIPILETLRFTVDYDASATPKITEDTPVYHSLETECLFHVLPWLEHPDSPGAFIRYQSVVFVKQMLEVRSLPVKLIFVSSSPGILGTSVYASQSSRAWVGWLHQNPHPCLTNLSQ